MYRGANGARRILQSSHLSAARCGGTTHWSLGDTYLFISKYCTSTPGKDVSEPVTSSSSKSSKPAPSALLLQQQHSLSRLKSLCTIQLKQASFRRHFHDYFTTAVTNGSPPPVAMPPNTTTNPPEPSTIVRIPLNRAKQHYGFLRSRGNRPYNEDWSQAGVLDLPLQSLIQASNTENNSKSGFFSPSSAPSNSVFYYAVFDGHGGDECSIFLKSRLHEYIENTAKQFYPTDALPSSSTECEPGTTIGQNAEEDLSQQGLRKKLQAQLIKEWNDIVGGYFRRFQPNFSGPSTTTEPVKSDIRGWKGSGSADDATSVSSPLTSSSVTGDGSWESILTYAFLRADLDFITGKWRNTAEQQLAVEDGKKSPKQTESGTLKAQQAKGGSTASVALIFTSPSSNVPYWSPNATSTLLTAHIGDTRILLSNTKTGAATTLTSSHHPSHPLEARRLRRYTAAFMSDSFGEERFGVLANTRAFGDAQQKRLGITAEPEVTRRELKGTEWAFMVLCSDGVSGVLSDQEIVDIVKEAKTPEEGAKAVVDFAEEVVGRANGGGDNSTCMVVRLGGWEKRAEGGEGSKGTRELRKWRSKQEPTARRQ